MDPTKGVEGCENLNYIIFPQFDNQLDKAKQSNLARKSYGSYFHDTSYHTASRRCRVGVGMNRSARGGGAKSVKPFERSNGLGTALYKNYLYLYHYKVET